MRFHLVATLALSLVTSSSASAQKPSELVQPALNKVAQAGSSV